MATDSLQVHPLSCDPCKAWEELKPSQTLVKLKMKPLDSPILPDQVRFVCMSDTHAMTRRLPFEIPPGDVYLHAGDFTHMGQADQVARFNDFLGTLPHKYKIVIAGNHELSFDEHTNEEDSHSIKSILSRKFSKHGKDVRPRETLTNATYLQDSSTTIYGIKIYGTPWQPSFHNWAFNIPRGQPLMDKWNLIPDDTDILLTHTPPLGYGDFTVTDVHAGDVDLLFTVQKRVKAKYHIYGHIHEGYGMTTDGQTIFINAATCDVNYRPVNNPIIFDFPLPENYSKMD